MDFAFLAAVGVQVISTSGFEVRYSREEMQYYKHDYSPYDEWATAVSRVLRPDDMTHCAGVRRPAGGGNADWDEKNVVLKFL